MGLYQAHFFKTRHLGLGRLPYLLEDLAKWRFWPWSTPFSRPSFFFPFYPSPTCPPRHPIESHKSFTFLYLNSCKFIIHNNFSNKLLHIFFFLFSEYYTWEFYCFLWVWYPSSGTNLLFLTRYTCCKIVIRIQSYSMAKKGNATITFLELI